ncbi:MAG TPA: CDP-diacylglycerol--serine O-phosphatidyltransferase [Bacteroidales bacterium]|nr:CDP-diacylglycerol--serine O-phosphatidyltransferase [Bacteroidales bacterium]HQI69359.1 CDP-diacylglycerol--serine O-phosphatidyltransferase [Bacteroidales bacterium]
MKALRTNIANMVTSLNLLCGSIAIYLLFRDEMLLAVYFILAAAIFDFADGFVARLLKVKSELGKQLDSLSDVISFGLAPGIAMFLLLERGLDFWPTFLPSYVAFCAFLIPLFSAWRLAKFNIDERQTDHFIGLPTPANALLIFGMVPLSLGIGFPSWLPLPVGLHYYILHPAILIPITLVFSYLLVSPLPLIAMKFKTFAWKENKIRYIFILLSLIAILMFYFAAVPIIITLYIILSIIDLLIKRKK